MGFCIHGKHNLRPWVKRSSVGSPRDHKSRRLKLVSGCVKQNPVVKYERGLCPIDRIMVMKMKISNQTLVIGNVGKCKLNGIEYNLKDIFKEQILY